MFWLLLRPFHERWWKCNSNILSAIVIAADRVLNILGLRGCPSLHIYMLKALR